MADPFSLTSVTDNERARVYLSADGPMDSVLFIDSYIEVMKALVQPWRFDCLIDLLNCSGQPEFADFVRLWKFWIPVIHRATGLLKTAVVTEDPRTVGRMTAVAMLFPGHAIRTFRGMSEAETWLDMPTTTNTSDEHSARVGAGRSNDHLRHG